MTKIKPKARPQIASGLTTTLRTECGKLFITVNYNKEEDEIVEIMCKMGKTGSCSNSFLEVIGKVLSIAIRAGVDEEELFDQFLGVRCPAYIGNGIDNKPITSCLDGFIKQVKFLLEKQRNAQEAPKQ